VVVNGLFVVKSVNLESNSGVKVNYDPSNAAEIVPLAFTAGAIPSHGLTR
jgi:hypothetical protein